MKKIKLFALAIMAMLSTNTFAQGTDVADGYLRYNHDGTNATITGFVANREQAAVEIPATVTDPVNTNQKYKVTAIGINAFKGKTIIESVTIADENVAQISAGAFQNCSNLTTVTIGKKVTNIDNVAAAASYAQFPAGPLTVGDTYYTSAAGAGMFVADGTEAASDGTNYWTFVPASLAGAFEGCSKLTTVTFNAPIATDVRTIAEGTFKNTGIVTLDLTSSNIQILNPLFELLNTTLTTVVLPASLQTINANAFKQLAALTTVDFTACTVNDLTINANAFESAPLIKSLTLPAKLAVLADNALAGSNIQTLTITSYAENGTGKPTLNDQTGATKLTTLIVNGDFYGTIGKYAALTSVTFNDKVKNAGAIETGAFVACTKLATVEFKGEMIAGAVDAGSFGTSATVFAGSANLPASDGTRLTITYKPEATVSALAFSKTAYAAAASATDYKAKLVTTTAYRNVLNDDGYTPAANANYLCILIDAAAATFNLKVAKGGTGSYYYAKLYAADAYKIAKKQTNDVIVYGAYVDDADAKIYMENLKIIDGFYYIPANTAVIVKTKQSADVILTEDDASGNSSVRMDADGVTPSSQIYVPATSITGSDQIDARNTYWAAQVPPVAHVPYFVAPIADYGFLWSQFADERVLKGQETANKYNPVTGETVADFLIDCPVIAGARLSVVWLDGSEESATAIQTVKKVAAENGAIYNLAGQKVSAAYKGVVIKDGKKFIQK